MRLGSSKIRAEEGTGTFCAEKARGTPAHHTATAHHTAITHHTTTPEAERCKGIVEL
jgi:hypothetical protein